MTDEQIELAAATRSAVSTRCDEARLVEHTLLPAAPRVALYSRYAPHTTDRDSDPIPIPRNFPEGALARCKFQQGGQVHYSVPFPRNFATAS